MTEIDRILALARGPDPAVPGCGVELFPAQRAALTEWARALTEPPPVYGPPGGAILAGVGAGKTLIGLLLPHVAQVVTGVQPRTTYLVPASLRDQLVADHAAWFARGAAVGPTPPDVLSHEALSAPSGRDALRARAPDLLVIDEVHGFAEPTSARWRRVVELLQYRPDTRVVVMSGSLSWRSLLQCRHVLLAALRGWCPLPADRSIEWWAASIDVDGEPSDDDRRVLAPLRQWAGVPDDRAAYRIRLQSCPGVTVTSAASTPAALRVRRLVDPRPPPSVAEALAGLVERWELPDGTELVSSLEWSRHLRTLALGAYRPPTVGPHDELRREWARQIRALVTYQGHRYQSPSAVVREAEAGTLGGRAQAAHDAWAEVAPDEDRAVAELEWVDGGSHLRAILSDVVDSWEGAPAVVWTSTPEIGLAAAAVLGTSYHGAGSTPPTSRRAVASIRVHGTGWAGAPAAGYNDALVLEPPSSGHTWEQLLGRLHRTGCAEEIRWQVYAPGPAAGTLHRAVEQARYVRDTTGAAQRLLLADWSGIAIDRTGS